MEDADGNKIEFVFNTNTGNNSRNKTAVLIQSDLQKLGFKVIFQPVEFNTLIHKIDDTYNYECVLHGPGRWRRGPGFSDERRSNPAVSRINGFRARKRPRPIGRRAWTS